MHHATQNGHKEMVILLVINEADVNAKMTNLFQTSLDTAEDKVIAEIIRKHGGKAGEALKSAGK